ncbi:MAG TPA: sigma-70 family RNA polymerase sigma factor [Phycisphaerales bacterium]|nr:sigma-70 family RNA polymerase sigma factor [Phycisphaerales bacterium]HMP36985.1 sigma-70 family RNA polymerase sigma factor [Phycisphaerales bacterium]
MEPRSQSKASGRAAHRGVRGVVEEGPSRQEPSLASGRFESFEERLAAAGHRIALSLRIAPELAGWIDRDDIMQVTYLEAYLAHASGALSSDSTARPLQAWLRRAAENNLRDAIAAMRAARRPPPRRRASPAAGEDSILWLHRQATSGGTTPSGGCARAELAEMMRREIQRLPPIYREVLDLVIFRGMSHAEAGAALGRTRGAVSLLQQRAIAALRQGVGG